MLIGSITAGSIAKASTGMTTIVCLPTQACRPTTSPLMHSIVKPVHPAPIGRNATGGKDMEDAHHVCAPRRIKREILKHVRTTLKSKHDRRKQNRSPRILLPIQAALIPRSNAPTRLLPADGENASIGENLEGQQTNEQHTKGSEQAPPSPPTLSRRADVSPPPTSTGHAPHKQATYVTRHSEVNDPLKRLRTDGHEKQVHDSVDERTQTSTTTSRLLCLKYHYPTRPAHSTPEANEP